MKGKICVVTGANSGIGKVTARELARMGATVIMVCRDRKRSEPVVQEIRQETGNPLVELMLCDFSSQESIRQFAAEYRQRYDRLHVLVNNAGALMPHRSVTVDGYETTFAVNHLGYFLLTNLLLDLIKVSAPARIINVSSGAHAAGRIHFDDLMGERRYSAWMAYGQSKLANILFTKELARRLDGSGVTVNALHPGFVRTRFGTGSKGSAFLMGLLSPFTITPEQGAETSIYLASSPAVEGVTGEYFVRKRVAKPSAEARDAAVAKRLWQVSEELTGLA